MEIPLKPRPKGARKPGKKPPAPNGAPAPGAPNGAPAPEAPNGAPAPGAPNGAQAPEARNAYATTPDGVQIFYSVEGEGEPLVFCYGLVCSSLHWTYQIDHFKRTHQSIWFDYRAHHNSSTPGDLSTLTIPHFARDLTAVFDSLGLRKAVLLGHSMGTSVALEFYRQNPDRVKALVLANGTAKRPLETLLNNPNIIPSGFNILRAAYSRSPNFFSRVWKLQKGNALMRTIVKLAGFNPHLAADEDVERYVSQIEEMDPGVLLHVLEAYQTYDATAWLHTVKAPTLILSGDEDKVTPPPQQGLLHQLIPGSRLESVRHGSHCPQMDQPELVAAKIEQFLASLK